MSPRPSGPRRVCAELRFSAPPPTLPSVAGRALHQYWSLLSPHFRGVFLPPQWRAEGTGLTWSWREPAVNNPLSASELSTLRKRLTAAQRSLAETAEDATLSDSRRTVVSLSQIKSCSQDVVTALLALPDPALASYTVRTEQGPLLHSWGLSPALVPFYPDTSDCEISGTVFAARQPAPDHEVLLETPGGNDLARTHSDATGVFRFPKISPGHYRVRVVASPASFPPEGLTVEVQRASLTGLELHDNANTRAPFSPGRSAARRRLVYAVACALVLVLIGIRLWRQRTPAAPGQLVDSTTALRSPRAAFDPGGNAPEPSPATASSPSSQPGSRAVLSADLSPVPRPAISRTALPRRDPLAPPGSARATASAASASSIQSPLAGGFHPISAANSTPTPPAPPPSSATSTAPVAGVSSTPAPSPLAQNSPPPTASPSPPFAVAPPTPPATPPTSPHEENPPPVPASSAPAPQKAKIVSTRETATRPTSPDLSKAHPDSADQAAVVPSEISDAAVTSPASSSDPGTERSFDRLPAAVASTSSTPPDTKSATASESTVDPKNAATPALSADARHLRLRLSPWRLRLLQDTILPTHPTRGAEQETVDALRVRLFRERQQQIPESFRHPDIQRGFALNLPPSTAASAPAFWRDAAGAAPAGATATASHAEFTWRPTEAPTTIPATFTLLSAQHRELARVIFDSNGEATLTTAPDVQGWPWLALIEPGAPSTAGFDWQVLSGPTAPATWRHDALTTRLDLIAPPGETGLHQRTLALVHPSSGWALVCDLSAATEPPHPAFRSLSPPP